MFSTDIVTSDVFLDMPASAQALYFQLALQADDDGFMYPNRVMRMAGASREDLDALTSKKFILTFPSGVAVIKHWNVSNRIRKDRHRRTPHKKELAMIKVDEAGVYRTVDNPVDKLVANPQPVGCIGSKVVSKVEGGSFSKEKRGKNASGTEVGDKFNVERKNIVDKKSLKHYG